MNLGMIWGIVCLAVFLAGDYALDFSTPPQTFSHQMWVWGESRTWVRALYWCGAAVLARHFWG